MPPSVIRIDDFEFYNFTTRPTKTLPKGTIVHCHVRLVEQRWKADYTMQKTGDMDNEHIRQISEILEDMGKWEMLAKLKADLDKQPSASLGLSGRDAYQIDVFTSSDLPKRIKDGEVLLSFTLYTHEAYRRERQKHPHPRIVKEPNYDFPASEIEEQLRNIPKWRNSMRVASLLGLSPNLPKKT